MAFAGIQVFHQITWTERKRGKDGSKDGSSEGNARTVTGKVTDECCVAKITAHTVHILGTFRTHFVLFPRAFVTKYQTEWLKQKFIDS